jgi:hypothetical protein
VSKTELKSDATSAKKLKGMHREELSANKESARSQATLIKALKNEL